MSDDRDLRRRAKAAGIMTDWIDINGRKQVVSIDSMRALVTAVGEPRSATKSLPALITARVGERLKLPPIVTGPVWLQPEGGTQRQRLDTRDGAAMAPDIPGYHSLEIGGERITLAVAPGAPKETATHREWGLTVQLYSLYRPGDGGIGSYGALRTFMRGSAAAGASAVAVSPLHAQFSADLHRFSPYSPSSRLWMNVLHIDAGEASAAFGVKPTKLAPRLGAGRDALINWPESSRAKLAALRALYDALDQRGELAGSTALARNLAVFRRAGGESLLHHAQFEALHAHFFGHDHKLWHWHSWPEAHRDPNGAAVKKFAREHADVVAFHIFLQWLAAAQFKGAAEAGNDAGMRLGIIKDIAIGADSGGSEAWGSQGRMLRHVSIGAPPDAFNTLGQSWGVTTFSPAALAETGYSAFIGLLRAALRDAGGIRIDHVLGLRRLWIVPDGAGPREGAYITYPLEDLLRLAALEAHRAKAVVLGEDLGTVQPGFREQLADFGIKGMQVMWFERQGKGFLPPRQWRPGAVAMTTTHDLPTVAGWWTGRDLAWRKKLKLFATPKNRANADADRKRERVALWDAFRRADVTTGKPPAASETGKVVAAAIAYLGTTACDLALLPLEDALGRKEQPNLPGTISEHPNWRRRILIDAGEICSQKVVARRLRRLAAARAKP